MTGEAAKQHGLGQTAVVAHGNIRRAAGDQRAAGAGDTLRHSRPCSADILVDDNHVRPHHVGQLDGARRINDIAAGKFPSPTNFRLDLPEAIGQVLLLIARCVDRWLRNGRRRRHGRGNRAGGCRRRCRREQTGRSGGFDCRLPVAAGHAPAQRA